MKMSTSSLVMLLILVIGTLFAGCQSAHQKEEADTIKMMSADLSVTYLPAIAKAIVNPVDADEWETFKTEAEAKIRSNEMVLAELSVQLNKPGSALDTLYVKRIATLNQQNQAFKTRLEAFEKNRNDWETFKRDFNHDMDEFEKEIKNLAATTKN